MRKLTAELWQALPPELPDGWTWQVVRIVHVMPDDTVDGYRVSLACRNHTVVEVIHRDQLHAQRIALEAAADIWPAQFKGVRGCI